VMITKTKVKWEIDTCCSNKIHWLKIEDLQAVTGCFNLRHEDLSSCQLQASLHRRAGMHAWRHLKTHSCHESVDTHHARNFYRTTGKLQICFFSFNL
jgi:hypothetical protein